MRPGRVRKVSMIILVGGLRLNELYDYLAALDPPLSFESVPSVDEQTIAGVCSKMCI